METLGKHKFRLPDFTLNSVFKFIYMLSATQQHFYAFLVHYFSPMLLLHAFSSFLKLQTFPLLTLLMLTWLPVLLRGQSNQHSTSTSYLSTYLHLNPYSPYSFLLLHLNCPCRWLSQNPPFVHGTSSLPVSSKASLQLLFCIITIFQPTYFHQHINVLLFLSILKKKPDTFCLLPYVFST